MNTAGRGLADTKALVEALRPRLANPEIPLRLDLIPAVSPPVSFADYSDRVGFPQIQEAATRACTYCIVRVAREGRGLEAEQVESELAGFKGRYGDCAYRDHLGAYAETAPERRSGAASREARTA